MATTVSNATLKVVIEEDIILSGSQRGSRTELSIADIDEYSRRVMTALTSATRIVAFDSAVSTGTYIDSNVKYIRITNLDSEYYVTLHLDAGSEDSYVKLPAGYSYILGAGASVLGTDSSLVNLDLIFATANTAPVDLEVVVASG